MRHLVGLVLPVRLVDHIVLSLVCLVGMMHTHGVEVWSSHRLLTHRMVLMMHSSLSAIPLLMLIVHCVVLDWVTLWTSDCLLLHELVEVKEVAVVIGVSGETGGVFGLLSV